MIFQSNVFHKNIKFSLLTIRSNDIFDIVVCTSAYKELFDYVTYFNILGNMTPILIIN